MHERGCIHDASSILGAKFQPLQKCFLSSHLEIQTVFRLHVWLCLAYSPLHRTVLRLTKPLWIDLDED